MYAPGTVMPQLYAPDVVSVEPEAKVSTVAEAGLVKVKFEMDEPFR